MLLSIPIPSEVGRSKADLLIARAYDYGFQAISIHCSPEAEYLDLEWLRRIRASYGLEVALHTPTKNFDLSAPLEDVRRLSVSYAIRMVKTGEAVDALYYEIHLGGNLTYTIQREFALDNAMRSLREILALKPSATVTIENDDRGYIFSDYMILLEVLDRYPAIMLTLDVAHTYRSGGKLQDFIKSMESRMYAVHLHDIVDGRDHYQLGLGSIDWPSIVRSISKANLKVVVFETHHGEYDLVENAYKSVDFLRRYYPSL